MQTPWPADWLAGRPASGLSRQQASRLASWSAGQPARQQASGLAGWTARQPFDKTRLLFPCLGGAARQQASRLAGFRSRQHSADAANSQTSSAGFQVTLEAQLMQLCHSIFVDPVSLPCGHSFCRGCAADWLAMAQAGGGPAGRYQRAASAAGATQHVVAGELGPQHHRDLGRAARRGDQRVLGRPPRRV